MLSEVLAITEFKLLRFVASLKIYVSEVFRLMLKAFENRDGGDVYMVSRSDFLFWLRAKFYKFEEL